MKIKKIILPLFVLLFTTSCSDTPEVMLKALDDKDHALSEFLDQGKWTIVNIWSTSCPYCRMEMQDLQDFHDLHKDKDATVLGIAIDFPSFGYPKPQSVKAYTQDYFIDFPSLLSDAKQISEILGQDVRMIPITLFYNPDGEFAGRWEGTITQQEIEKVIAEAPENTGPFGSGYRSSRGETLPES